MAISPVNRHDLCRVLFSQRVMGLCLFLLTCPVSACAGQVYYVDGLSGSDRANGRTKETAWKTTAGVNSTELQPGDTVSFAKGRIYSILRGGELSASLGAGS